MRRLFTASALGLLLAASSTAGLYAQAPGSRLPADPELRTAYLDWDRGDYHLALRRYLRVLRSTEAGDPVVRTVAELTGEIHPVREIALDGSQPTVGPEGRFASYEVVDSDGVPEIRVITLPGGDPAVTIAGGGAVHGAGGRLAYLALEALPEEVGRLLGEANEALQAGDRRGYFTRVREAAWGRAAARHLHLRDLSSGADREVPLDDVIPGTMAFDERGALWVAGVSRNGMEGRLVRVEDGEAEVVSLRAGFPISVHPTTGGRVAVTLRERPSLPSPPGARVPSRGEAGVVLLDGDREVDFLAGARELSVSADGSTLAFLASVDGESRIVGRASGSRENVVLHVTDRPVSGLAVAPDGAHVAFQERPLHDWEVFAVSAAGGGQPVQLSDEIQHDRYPRWVDAGTVLAAKGEGRHMRSYLYHLDGTPPLKLFHNNTVRTIAPEYEWAPALDGRSILVVSERDGDTVSPERGVYLVDRTRVVTLDTLVARLEAELAKEEALRLRSAEAFRSISSRVRPAVDAIQVERVSAYAADLYALGSKFFTQPGNREAVDYLVATLESWGYEPELQWFEPSPGMRTANVVARVEGTEDPELVYVVTSHFDSTERGPGADDNTSGTTALLEVARVLAERPLPTTVEFAFLTAEEAGLLGAREYVRRAVAEGKQVVGALNNDMVGWANDHRLDNTIRYSNPGIRDIQHGAALLFSDLITYDALYYKSTDAQALYDAYGDVIGGIGSYPVLGNPHYHQATDRLETINQRLVTEVSRTTAATLMLLASSPARLTGLTLAEADQGFVLSWDAARESSILEYTVIWTAEDGTLGEMRTPASSAVERVAVSLPELPEGTRVSVKAINARGLVGWDWAVTEVGGGS